MSDIVERLRNTPNWKREERQDWKECILIYDRAPFEAADTIEQLRRERDAMLNMPGMALFGASEELTAAHAEIARLKEENFALAAGQCIINTGLCGDEHGNQYCAVNVELMLSQQQAEEATRRAEEAEKVIEKCRPYMRHKKECCLLDTYASEAGCTCGLGEALAAIDAHIGHDHTQKEQGE